MHNEKGVMTPGSDDKSPTTGLASYVKRNEVIAPDSDDKSSTAGLTLQWKWHKMMSMSMNMHNI
jgi:hypothetical protein